MQFRFVIAASLIALSFSAAAQMPDKPSDAAEDHRHLAHRCLHLESRRRRSLLPGDYRRRQNGLTLRILKVSAMR